jgi:polyhydroxybutyrate depolymerase
MKLALFILALPALLLVTAPSYGSDIIRSMPKWTGRPYKLHIPPKISGRMPLVLALHGGGGNREAQEKLTCPNGDLNSPKCLSALADRMGFIIAYPNGTGSLDGCEQDPKWCEVRTWNSGGGVDGFNCSSGYACTHAVDDIAFFKDLIADISSVVSVDSSRIYATGLSNGGAMSFRLACEMSDKIAAIAPVGAGNQFLTSGICNPNRAVPLLQIHGSGDGTWPYEGGYSNVGTLGLMYSVYYSITNWLQLNNCVSGAGESRWLTDKVRDGTHVLYFENTRCKKNSEVVHYYIENGGHKWPDGYDYNPNLGLVSRQINANQVILEFFSRHHLRK